MKVLVVLSYKTLCNPMDCSQPGSSVNGILQAKILEGVAISFSRDLPKPGTEHGSPILQADYLPTKPPGKSTCIQLISTSTIHQFKKQSKHFFKVSVLICSTVCINRLINPHKNYWGSSVIFDSIKGVLRPKV